MKITSQQFAVAVAAIAQSHVVLTDAALQTFKFFQSAVAGSSAVEDFDAKVAEIEATVLRAEFADSESPDMRLFNEWQAFVKSLKAAYGNFGYDVVRRQGVDDQSQVRNLALSIAGQSFTRIREASRTHMVTLIESAGANAS